MKKDLGTRRFKMVTCDIHNLRLKLRMLGRRVLLMLYASEPTLQKQICSFEAEPWVTILESSSPLLKLLCLG